MASVTSPSNGTSANSTHITGTTTIATTQQDTMPRPSNITPGPSQPPTVPLPNLAEAIRDAPPEVMRELVRHIWGSVPQAQGEIESYLLTPASGSTTGRKCKAHEVCKHCYVTFEVVNNPPDACRHHPGYQEMDENSDVWSCWGPENGDPEHKMDDPELASGFHMMCCNARPYEPGCVVSAHAPQTRANKAKKRRTGPLVDVEEALRYKEEEEEWERSFNRASG